MDVYLHTFLAFAAMYGCFLWGKYLTWESVTEEIVGHTLEKLEDEGYIKTETDSDGDKTLIKITE